MSKIKLNSKNKATLKLFSVFMTLNKQILVNYLFLTIWIEFYRCSQNLICFQLCPQPSGHWGSKISANFAI